MNQKWIAGAVVALIAGLSPVAFAATAAEPVPEDFARRCAALAQLALPLTDPLTANVVGATSAQLPGQTVHLPAYCRVRAVVRPAIHVEVRLPVDSAWNGRYFQSGCGGLCGDVLTDYPHLFNSSLPGLARGYATATSDTGHAGSNVDGRWGYASPQAEEDFAYRSIGATATLAKAVIRQFYAPRTAVPSIFSGCSTGGRLAVKAALKYPNEFNGIVAGAPGLDYPGLVGTAFAWLERANTGPDGGRVFNAGNTDKAKLIYETTLAQCDGLDGVVDGSIADPRRCRPDLSALACGLADGPQCLSSVELRTLELWRRGAQDRFGRPLYPGGVPEGSELYWGLWLTGAPAYAAAFPNGFVPPIALDFLRYLAFETDPGPAYQLTDFDFDRDPARMSASAALLNADDPDLGAFQKAGGRMLMYHGWADPLVTPYKSVDYFEAVAARAGGSDAADGFVRLFMIPGMDHCGVQSAASPGPGVDERSIDPLTALEHWLFDGSAPDTLTMHAWGPDNSSVAWSRPICRFPQRTVLKDGAGDWRDPASWTCR